MLKYISFAVLNVLLANIAKCQSADTSIAYYKQMMTGVIVQVNRMDGADFIRIITPPDSGDDRRNVKEFYKNGKIKLIGKADPRINNSLDRNMIRLIGDCISFFETGKKQSIFTCEMGIKIGVEYDFYPNGSSYCTIKHGSSIAFIENNLWECFDNKGVAICKDGNGQWLEYDNDFKDIVFSGPVKKSQKDGEWHGKIMSPDSIKYTATFNKGILVSGVGYDKTGTAYPYKKNMEKADYKQGPIVFIEVLKNHLIVPRGPDGKKVPMDKVVISFIVEKDGQLSNQVVLGEAGPELKEALLTALTKCKDWLPGRFYGIPLRTQVTLPLKYASGYQDRNYTEDMYYQEKVLGF